MVVASSHPCDRLALQMSVQHWLGREPALQSALPQPQLSVRTITPHIQRAKACDSKPVQRALREMLYRHAARNAVELRRKSSLQQFQPIGNGERDGGAAAHVDDFRSLSIAQLGASAVRDSKDVADTQHLVGWYHTSTRSRAENQERARTGHAQLEGRAKRLPALNGLPRLREP
jgi:hypothetical protein